MAISLNSNGLSLNYPTSIKTVNPDLGNHTLSPAPPVGCFIYLQTTGENYYLILGGTYLSFSGNGSYITKLEMNSYGKLLRVA